MLRPSNNTLRHFTGGVFFLLGIFLTWTAVQLAPSRPELPSAPVSASTPVPIEAPVEPQESCPLIALTFDDGPSSLTTPGLLDGLSQRGVHATFFLVGSMAQDNHSLVRRMAQEGHQIAVHTYDHDSTHGLTGLSESQFHDQVDSTKQLITSLTGQTEFALRPPYGFVDDNVKRWADGPIILWSVDPEDWRDRNQSRIVEHVLNHVEDGSIVLLHDIFASSTAAALDIIDALLAKGYRFVTVNELFEARGVPPVAGEVYYNLAP